MAFQVVGRVYCALAAHATDRGLDEVTTNKKKKKRKRKTWQSNATRRSPTSVPSWWSSVCRSPLIHITAYCGAFFIFYFLLLPLVSSVTNSCLKDSFLSFSLGRSQGLLRNLVTDQFRVPKTGIRRCSFLFLVSFLFFLIFYFSLFL